MSMAMGTVTIGSRVRVKDGADEDEFEIVVPAEADAMQGLISSESPMGRALLGRTEGDEVKVKRPQGTAFVVILGHVPDRARVR